MFPRVSLRQLQSHYPDIDVTAVASDPETAYQVAEATLAHYFGLSVRLSRTHLCPRIPVRLQYLTVMERLCEPTDVVREYLRVPPGVLVDIGTGSSAIYPLLHHKAHWVATECNRGSYDHARHLVNANGLKDHITLLHQAQWPVVPVRYSVSNPPFYHDEADLKARHHAKQGHKPGANLPLAPSELYYPGGEVAFIKWMIKSSKDHNIHPYAWYSSLVGIYDDIGSVIDYLHQLNVTNRVVVPLRLGLTTRWVVAWAFHSVPAPVGLDCPPQERICASGTLSLTTKPHGDYVVALAPTWLRKYRRGSLERQQELAGLIVAKVDGGVQVVANASGIDDVTVKNLLLAVVAGCEPAQVPKRQRRA